MSPAEPSPAAMLAPSSDDGAAMPEAGAGRPQGTVKYISLQYFVKGAMELYLFLLLPMANANQVLVLIVGKPRLLWLAEAKSLFALEGKECHQARTSLHELQMKLMRKAILR